MFCFVCNKASSDKHIWVILSRRIKRHECSGCHAGFDSEAVVQICKQCAEKGIREPLSIKSTMEPLLVLERDTILQYLRRTANSKTLYPSAPLPAVCMSCRAEIENPPIPVQVEIYMVRFEWASIDSDQSIDLLGVSETWKAMMCRWCRSNHDHRLQWETRSSLAPIGSVRRCHRPIESNELKLGQVCGRCATEHWGVDAKNGRLQPPYDMRRAENEVSFASLVKC